MRSKFRSHDHQRAGEREANAVDLLNSLVFAQLLATLDHGASKHTPINQCIAFSTLNERKFAGIEAVARQIACATARQEASAFVIDDTRLNDTRTNKVIERKICAFVERAHKRLQRCRLVAEAVRDERHSPRRRRL